MANQNLSTRLNAGAAAVVIPGTSDGLVSKNGVPGNVTGSAIAASYIGQMLHAFAADGAVALLLNSSYYDICSVAMQTGLWLVTGAALYNRNGATCTTADFVAAISTTSGNSSSGLTVGLNFFDSGSSIPTSFSRAVCPLPATYVRCDGTNCIFSDGTTLSGTTLYLKGYSGAASGGNMTASGKLEAVRIA